MLKGKSIEEAIATLEAGGVKVLRVEYTLEDAPTITFEKDGIATILGVQQVEKLVCFADLRTLNQENFNYIPQNYIDTASSVDFQLITYDLSLDPKLKRFKHYIDQLSVVRCCVPYAGSILVFEVKEPWYDEYLDALEAVR